MSLGEAFTPALTGAQANAGWAFERLYRDLAPAVFGYLRLQGAREPEDLTSEVFMGAFGRLNSFHGSEEQFRSWVFTIAYRRLVDERRRSARRPTTTGVPSEEWRGEGDHDGVGGNVEVDALSRLGEQRVRQLCQSLSSAQRDVLLLRLVAGLTLEQVADLLGKSVGAIKALQCRGLAALRAHLAPECVSI